MTGCDSAGNTVETSDDTETTIDDSDSTNGETEPPPEWKAVGNVGISDGEVNYTDIAIDSNGRQYIVYTDFTDPDGKNNPATVEYYNGSSWEYVGGFPGISHESGAGGGAINLRIAIDSNNVPYIVYRDFDNSPSGVAVMKYTGSSSETDAIDGDGWEYVGLTQSSSSTIISAGQASYSDIVIDSNNTPYVVYNDFSINSGNGAVTVMKYTGNNSETDAVNNDGWEYVDLGTTPRISDGDARGSNIVLDSNDTPYVSYEDAANSYGATVLKYTGNSGETDAVSDDGWEYVGPSANFAENYQDLHLALDSTDTPYVVFADSNNNMNATVMKYTGNTNETDRVANDGWEYVDSTGFSSGAPGSPYFTRIAINSSDTPYVVYQGDSDVATVRKYQGESWTMVGTGEISAGAAEYFRITIDQNDTPYVVYQDGANSSKATVKAFD